MTHEMARIIEKQKETISRLEGERDASRGKWLRTQWQWQTAVQDLHKARNATEQARAYARLYAWWVKQLVVIADMALRRLGGGNSEVLRDLIEHIRTSPSGGARLGIQQ